SPVEVYCAPKNEFLEYVKKDSQAMTEVTNQILYDYAALIYRMQHIVFGNAYAKVASIILTAAKQFGEKSGEDISVPIRLTHQQIALSAGITRETASIEIKKLEKKGIIGYKGRMMEVKNLSKLEEEAFL
ncbi:MAG TPA: Crp/Fnr family transcriptional regulator, partial [Candidatus Nitrosocosmicus sp.]|nr:Crp/Fnr family transcriptional regulator [Candidatus Nitrosocosmicus sp.]